MATPLLPPCRCPTIGEHATATRQGCGWCAAELARGIDPATSCCALPGERCPREIAHLLRAENT